MTANRNNSRRHPSADARFSYSRNGQRADDVIKKLDGLAYTSSTVLLTKASPALIDCMQLTRDLSNSYAEHTVPIESLKFWEQRLHIANSPDRLLNDTGLRIMMVQYRESKITIK